MTSFMDENHNGRENKIPQDGRSRILALDASEKALQILIKSGWLQKGLRYFEHNVRTLSTDERIAEVELELLKIK